MYIDRCIKNDILYVRKECYWSGGMNETEKKKGIADLLILKAISGHPCFVPVRYVLKEDHREHRTMSKWLPNRSLSAMIIGMKKEGKKMKGS